MVFCYFSIRTILTETGSNIHEKQQNTTLSGQFQ
jgi:hypothetical protein